VTSATYQIIINGQLFNVDLPRLATVQIRALAGIPVGHSLMIEGHGNSPDLFLSEDTVVSLEKGPVHVYTMPQTMMG
jgi:hypothetical protein